jgi:hypothetical protein
MVTPAGTRERVATAAARPPSHTAEVVELVDATDGARHRQEKSNAIDNKTCHRAHPTTLEVLHA